MSSLGWSDSQTVGGRVSASDGAERLVLGVEGLVMGIHALCLPEGVDVDSVLRDEDYGFDSVESQDNADELFADRREADAAYFRVKRRRKSRSVRFEIPAYGD